MLLLAGLGVLIVLFLSIVRQPSRTPHSIPERDISSDAGLGNDNLLSQEDAQALAADWAEEDAALYRANPALFASLAECCLSSGYQELSIDISIYEGYPGSYVVNYRDREGNRVYQGYQPREREDILYPEDVSPVLAEDLDALEALAPGGACIELYTGTEGAGTVRFSLNGHSDMSGPMCYGSELLYSPDGASGMDNDLGDGWYASSYLYYMPD